MKNILLAIIVLFASAFSPAGDIIEFSTPVKENAVITIKTTRFKKINKDLNGNDCYYSTQTDDGLNFSVLFYKLNDDEVLTLVEAPAAAIGGPTNSPAYPLTYFSTNSQTRSLETNERKWGKPTEDFMFRQADIKEFQGQKVNQKNMYAYTMFDKDLFVNIHISKMNCTPKDSTEMRQILSTLVKKK